MVDIEDKLEAVFKAHGKTAKDKVNKVDKTKLPELSAEEVAKMGLPAVPTTQEPMTAVPELNLEVINLPDKLIFAIQHFSEPINSTSMRVKSNSQNNQNKDTERFAYCILADQISMISNRCKSKQDLLI